MKRARAIIALIALSALASRAAEPATRPTAPASRPATAPTKTDQQEFESTAKEKGMIRVRKRTEYISHAGVDDYPIIIEYWAEKGARIDGVHVVGGSGDAVVNLRIWWVNIAVFHAGGPEAGKRFDGPYTSRTPLIDDPTKDGPPISAEKSGRDSYIDNMRGAGYRLRNTTYEPGTKATRPYLVFHWARNEAENGRPIRRIASQRVEILPIVASDNSLELDAGGEASETTEPVDEPAK